MKVKRNGKTIKLYPERYRDLDIMSVVQDNTVRLTKEERIRLEVAYVISNLARYEREIVRGIYKECRMVKDDLFMVFDGGPNIRVNLPSAKILGIKVSLEVTYTQTHI